MEGKAKNPNVKIAKFISLNLSKYIEEDKGNATLQWSVRNGYPRVTVFCSPNVKSIEGTMDYGKIITAPFTVPTVFIFTKYMKSILADDSPGYYTIECYNTRFKDGKRTDEIYLQAKVIVGKDENGIIYLSALEEGKRSIKFDMLPDGRWFKFYDKEGKEVVNKVELSKAYAQAYIKVLEENILAVENKIILDSVVNLDLNTKSEGLPTELQKVPDITVKEPDSLDDFL